MSTRGSKMKKKFLFIIFIIIYSTGFSKNFSKSVEKTINQTFELSEDNGVDTLIYFIKKHNQLQDYTDILNIEGEYKHRINLTRNKLKFNHFLLGIFKEQ